MIDFMKYKTIYFVISAIVIIPGIVSLIMFGLKPSIDFTGGSLLEVGFLENQANIERSKELIPEGIELNTIQTSGENNLLLKLKPITREQSEDIKSNFSGEYGQIEEVRFETVGPTIGKELLRKTLFAVAAAAGAILIYVMYQFSELKYGVSAVLAMFHDSLILLGTFSLLGHYYGVEVDTLFVTAVLTILSFSVHDTIVVYDRIRETLRKNRKAKFIDIVNKSVAETLGRSINNSMTIIFMLLALWLLGGETTKWFVFALLVGTITGTYSSTFTAAPLLILWEEIKAKRKN
ncbi:protein translocase subunit SecF [Patescibacteria group bacterium]